MDVALGRLFEDLDDSLHQLDSTRCGHHHKVSLLVVRHLCLHLTLDIAKELFDWVQPGTVLSIEEDIDFEPSASFKDCMMSVDHRVVHQYDDGLGGRSWLSPQVVNDAEDKLLEEGRIECTLDDLRPDHFVLRHGSNERHGELLFLGRLLPDRQEQALVAIFTELVFETSLVLCD